MGVVDKILKRAGADSADKNLKMNLQLSIKELADIMQFLDYTKDIHEYVPEDDQKAIFEKIMSTARHGLYSQRMVTLAPTDERNHTGVEALFEYIEGYENEPSAHVDIVSSDFETVEEFKLLKRVYESCIEEVSG